MFFVLSREKLAHFPSSHKLRNNWVLSTDQGWTHSQSDNRDFYFKGYLDRESSYSLGMDLGLHSGNFLCIEQVQSGEIFFHYPRERTFPLFFCKEKQRVSNFFHQDSSVLAYNESLRVDHLQSFITETCYVLPTPLLPRRKDSLVVDELYEYLLVKFRNFFSSEKPPIKLFLSGGLDTLCLYSFLSKEGIPFELYTEEHFEIEAFTENWGEQINGFWAYKQIHHWRDDSLLISGANGDESLLRGPQMGSLVLASFGMDPYALLQNSFRDSYHSRYLAREKNLKVLSRWRESLSEQKQSGYDLGTEILVRSIYDYQHWHLNKTLTYTPFKDVILTKILLQASPELICEQFFDGAVTKALIAKNNPKLLNYLSKYKNEEAIFSAKALIKDCS